MFVVNVGQVWQKVEGKQQPFPARGLENLFYIKKMQIIINKQLVILFSWDKSSF
jgi:hypothetical protein